VGGGHGCLFLVSVPFRLRLVDHSSRDVLRSVVCLSATEEPHTVGLGALALGLDRKEVVQQKKCFTKLNH